MDFEEKFNFVNRKLEKLLTMHLISEEDYVAISKDLMMTEYDYEMKIIMDKMKTAVMSERIKKEGEKKKRDETKRKREEEIRLM